MFFYLLVDARLGSPSRVTCCGLISKIDRLPSQNRALMSKLPQLCVVETLKLGTLIEGYRSAKERPDA